MQPLRFGSHCLALLKDLLGPQNKTYCTYIRTHARLLIQRFFPHCKSLYVLFCLPIFCLLSGSIIYHLSQEKKKKKKPSTWELIIQVLCKFGLSCFVGNLLFLDRWEKFLDTQLVNFCFFLIFFCYFLSGFLYVGLFGWSEFSVLMLQAVKKSCFSEVGFWCRCWELAERVDVEWERKKVRWGWITWIVCVSSILCLRSGYLRLFQSPFLFFIFLMYWYIFQVFVFVDLLILDLKKKKNWKRHMIYLGMWQLL